MLQKLLHTFKPYMQKTKFRALQGTCLQQKTTPMTYRHHPILAKPRMAEVKVIPIFSIIKVVVLNNNFLNSPKVLSDKRLDLQKTALSA